MIRRSLIIIYIKYILLLTHLTVRELKGKNITVHSPNEPPIRKTRAVGARWCLGLSLDPEAKKMSPRAQQQKLAFGVALKTPPEPLINFLDFEPKSPGFEN